MNKITSFHGQYAFLSNFYPSAIFIDGVDYPTVEHAFQAMKTLDNAERNRLALLPTPGQAKRAGRSVELRQDWELIKINVMHQCLLSKFAQPCFRDLLVATAPAQLIEGNTWGDKYWGCVYIRGAWDGQNNLGKLLMEIRDENNVLGWA